MNVATRSMMAVVLLALSVIFTSMSHAQGKKLRIGVEGAYHPSVRSTRAVNCLALISILPMPFVRK